MKRLSRGIGALGIVLLTGSPGLAQSPAGGGQPPPPPMTNLQVFPKDSPRAQIIQTMNAFNESLGVECNYCHVQESGRTDFASDAKREKRVARQMILMRDSINVMLPAIVGKPAGPGPTAGAGNPGAAPVGVTCRSCHRGMPLPRLIADVVTDASASGGVAAGLAKFKELRTQYYGGYQYDFSELGLLSVAQRAMTAKNPDAAIAYLQANLEYFPKSARTYQAMAQARTAKGDKQGAIRDLEKAVELDPTSAQTKAQLGDLKGQ
jgi:hypothetical protein